MNETFLNLRFSTIEQRFNEIDLLIRFAIQFESDENTYHTFCRSAHVLLVSHFEGIYKDVVRDIIDDYNKNTQFDELPKSMINTYLNYFLVTIDQSKATKVVKDKLKEVFASTRSKMKVEPFLFVDNKNPAPDVINTILERFGIADFFWSLKDSDLDIAFEDLPKETAELKNRLRQYLIDNTNLFPYNITTTIYNPILNTEKKSKTLWEDFLNEFLRERHSIIHGTTLRSPLGHQALQEAIVKIEIIIYAFIINLASIKPAIS